MENYKPAEDRYNDKMSYTFCGNSGLLLPRISLGLWHNFGDVDDQTTAKEMLAYAFDHGITHFDLANNYGPEPGSAERNFGKIFRDIFVEHRDELIISSKAGHSMWSGPYGDGSSRKSIMASIDQSLKRTGLDYFDIFYSHRYDGVTPIEETMQALVDIVKQGKALYIGISKYPVEKQAVAYNYLTVHGVPCLISQYRYSMFDRKVEQGNLAVAAQYGSGFIAFSPLAQGLLTNKYLKGIPENSRAARPTGFLQRSAVTPEIISKVSRLNDIAKRRGQTLAEMSLAWILKDNRVTSIIVGSSSVKQLSDNLKAIENLHFNEDELKDIEQILNENI
jgi:L-glyceraldehyde 3-phosphate reductase